jgi:hypothetical protein
MAKHNHVHVASIAAALLSGRHDAEPHHVKAAVGTANAILDEAYAGEFEDGAEPEAEAKPKSKAKGAEAASE